MQNYGLTQPLNYDYGTKNFYTILIMNACSGCEISLVDYWLVLASEEVGRAEGWDESLNVI